MMNIDSERLLEEQSRAWEGGVPCSIEQLLGENALSPETCGADVLLNLVCNEVRLRTLKGDLCTLAEYQERFPNFSEPIATQSLINDFFDDTQQGKHTGDTSTPGSLAEPFPDPATAAEMIERGSLYCGRYELLREVGRGAMGIVFEAYDPQLRRTVAIKRLKAGLNSAAGDKLRFALEAKSVAQLKHPAVVPLYDIGDADGGPFIAMEYCEGGTLSQRLRGSPLNPEEAARLLVEIADGVAAAHALKIIHRDLKPGNILLVDQQTLSAKVTDFGLAKWLDQDMSATSSGGLIGSPAYMPPEQVYGDSEAIGPAADIYSLGAILYECLTGSPPFRGATLADTLEQVRCREPVRIRHLVDNVPIDLETITLKCLNKLPANRYATAGALKEDLKSFLANRPIAARRPGWLELSVKWCKRNRSVAAILATFVAFVSLALIGLSVFSLLLKEEYEGKVIALAERTEALSAKAAALTALDAANLELRRGQEFAEQRFHNSQITLTQRALDNQEYARCEDLLDSVVPKAGQSDYRGFEWKWLKRKLHRDLLAEVAVGKGEVFALGFVNGANAVLAVGGEKYSGYACLLSANTGEVLMQQQLDATVNAAACDPTAARFAFGTGDGKLFVYDANRLELLHQADANFHFKAMCWSPDGRYLAAGSQRGELRLWSTSDWGLADSLTAEQGPILRLFFSRHGQRMFSSTDWGGQGKHSRQWKWHTGKLIAGSEFTNISLSDEAPDGATVVGMNWGQLMVASASTGEVLRSERVSGGPLASATFAEDGSQLIVAARNDREIRMLSASDLKQVRGLASRDTLSAVAIDRGSSRIATGDASGNVRLWNLQPERAKQELFASERRFTATRFRNDSDELLVASDGRVHVWEPVSDTLQALGNTKGGIEVPPGDLRAMTADATTLVYLQTPGAGSACTIHVHRPQQNSPLTLPLDYEIFEDCLQLSPSGRYLATRGDGGLMDVFDLRTDSTEPIYRLEAPCLTLAFSHREDLLVCGTQYGEVRVFRLSDGERLPNLVEFRSFWAWGLGVAFSHDDRYLAVGTEAGKVQVWRMEDRELIAELTGNRGEIRHIDFFDDGRRLVCDGAGIIRVWDFVAGQELLTLPLPEIDVKQLEVSQNERQVVAVTASGRTYLWSVD